MRKIAIPDEQRYKYSFTGRQKAPIHQFESSWLSIIYSKTTNVAWNHIGSFMYLRSNSHIHVSHVVSILMYFLALIRLDVMISLIDLINFMPCHTLIDQIPVLHQTDSWILHHGPLTRYVKLRVVHAPGMPGTFSSPLTSNEPAS